MKPAAPVTSTFLFAMHHSPKLLRRLKVNFSVDISLSRILTRNSAARIAQDNGMAGDIAVHICPRGDEDVVADINAPDDGGVYADPHAVSQYWRAFSLATVLLPDRHALVQVAVRSNDSGFVHRDVKGVPKVKPGPI